MEVGWNREKTLPESGRGHISIIASGGVTRSHTPALIAPPPFASRILMPKLCTASEIDGLLGGKPIDCDSVFVVVNSSFRLLPTRVNSGPIIEGLYDERTYREKLFYGAMLTKFSIFC